jgi:hypothetical protein
MSAAMASDRRGEVLRALGITPWVRRERAAAEEPVHAAGDAAPSGRCVVLIPAGGDVRAMDLLGRALNACGAELAVAGVKLLEQGLPAAR